MPRSNFFKLFTIVGFMLLPSLASAAEKQFVGISCDGIRTLQVVAEAKTDKQLIAGSDFQFTQYDEEAVQFSFFGDVFKVDRNTGSMSVNDADAMAGLSCNVETLTPISPSSNATDIKCSGEAGDIKFTIDNSFNDVLLNGEKFNVVQFADLIFLNSNRDVLTISRSDGALFNNMQLVKNTVCEITETSADSEIEGLLYMVNGTVNIDELNDWSLTDPMQIKKVELEEDTPNFGHEVELKAKISSGFDTEITAVIHLGFFDIENNFIGGCSEDEDISPGKDERIRCKILQPSRPRLKTIQYSIFAYEAE